MARTATKRQRKGTTAGQRRRRAIGRLRATQQKAQQEEEEAADESQLTGVNPRTSGKKIVFTGFRLAGDVYKPGDCVLIKQEEPDGPPYVAEMLSVYQYLDSDEICLVIRWYHRPEDIELKKSALPKLVEDELFASNYLDEIPAASVDGPCVVVHGSSDAAREIEKRYRRRHADGVVDSDDDGDGDGEGEDDDEDDMERFVCRWYYDVHKRKLTKYEQRPVTVLTTEARRLVQADTDEAKRGRRGRKPGSSGKTTGGRGRGAGKAAAKRARIADSDEEEGDDDDDDDDFEADESGLSDEEMHIEGVDGEESGSDAPSHARKRGKRKGQQNRAKGTRGRGRPRKRAGASSSSSSSRGRGRVKLAPQLKVPQAAEADTSTLDAMQRAKQRLQLSAVGAVSEALPCREVEFYEIMAFVQTKVESGSSGCMFVSGVPGTGKTATIRAVARELQAQRAAGDMPQFTFVEINGMALTTPKQAYVELWHSLADKKGTGVTASSALSMLNHRFTKPSPRRRAAVVLLDEVDQLYTKKQDVLYNMFDWPTHDHSHLILVAVANTMDLPERVFHQRVASRLGLTRLTFMPYTHQQLVHILQHRLSQFDCFTPDAIELCSRKVSAVSGDARRALTICQRAAEMARVQQRQQQRQGGRGDRGSGGDSGGGEADAETGSGQEQEQPALKVTIHHVSAAIKEMTSSPLLRAIEHASAQEKLFILATVAAFRQLGVEEATLEQIAVTHRNLCNTLAFPLTSPTVLSMVCSNLASTRIVLAESAILDIRRKVRLNCSTEDALFALRDEPGAKHLAAQSATSASGAEDEDGGADEGADAAVAATLG